MVSWQAFILAVLLLSVFEQRLSFRMYILKCRWGLKVLWAFMSEPCWGWGPKDLEKKLGLFTGGQIKSLKQKKPSKAGLKKLFVCRHPTLSLRLGLVSWSGFFFILVKVSLVPRTLPLFDKALLAGRTFICDCYYNR